MGSGRELPWSVLSFCRNISQERIRKTTKIIGFDSYSRNWDSELRSPKYTANAETTSPPLFYAHILPYFKFHLNLIESLKNPRRMKSDVAETF
jgi:hypothetical protein